MPDHCTPPRGFFDKRLPDMRNAYEAIVSEPHPIDGQRSLEVHGYDFEGRHVWISIQLEHGFKLKKSTVGWDLEENS